MKISEKWLREWVKTDISRPTLCEQLTMAGLEIEEVTPVAVPFFGVVIGQVLQIAKHPDAERLNICQVEVGKSSPLMIICGANNVKVGMKVAAALQGAVLGNQKTILETQLRGKLSQGMLCSARELGLPYESEGIIALPANAPIGANLWDYLDLSDHIMDVSITPNRGDCLSVAGLAYEIAAVTKAPLMPVEFHSVKPSISDTIPIRIDQPTACPHYVGRIIRDIRMDAITPIWMQERLHRGNVRSISPIVDVMNYVMLELGQPMHAFDFNTIQGDVAVRYAKSDESLVLLDGQTVLLDPTTLVIADQEKALAIGGVMGGLDSAVSETTETVLLESAFFAPASIIHTARHYHLQSESSYRFERGVDPLLQIKAIERATQLIVDIAGGKPGPVIDVKNEQAIPPSKTIHLRAARIEILLGIRFSANEVMDILSRLSFTLTAVEDGWKVTVPARRFDITLEADLIEEIARVYGYDQLPQRSIHGVLRLDPQPETELSMTSLRHLMCDLGFQEVVTYSFVSKKLQQLVDPGVTPKELINPITTDMAVMRTNLWPGLLDVFLSNQARQHCSMKLFETGLRFLVQEDNLLQQSRLSGLVSGSAYPEQWGFSPREVDFYDLKGDLENLFRKTLQSAQFTFQPGCHPALHPGQTAAVYRENHAIGIMGALHPAIAQVLDIQRKLFLFDFDLDELKRAGLPIPQEISKFPSIRRDIAILVDHTVPVQSIQDTIQEVAGGLLQRVSVFDVYQGKGVGSQQKSVALGLILQHSSRTLTDEEVADLMDSIVNVLTTRFAAELRG